MYPGTSSVFCKQQSPKVRYTARPAIQMNKKTIRESTVRSSQWPRSRLIRDKCQIQATRRLVWPAEQTSMGTPARQLYLFVVCRPTECHESNLRPGERVRNAICYSPERHACHIKELVQGRHDSSFFRSPAHGLSCPRRIVVWEPCGQSSLPLVARCVACSSLPLPFGPGYNPISPPSTSISHFCQSVMLFCWTASCDTDSRSRTRKRP